MAGCVSVLPGDVTTRHTSRVYVCARKMWKGNYTSVAFNPLNPELRSSPFSPR